MNQEQENQLANNRRRRNLIVVNYETFSVLGRIQQELSQARREQHNDDWNDNGIFENHLPADHWIPQYQIKQNAIYENRQRLNEPQKQQVVETSKSDPRFLLNQYRNEIEKNQDDNRTGRELIQNWLFRGVESELDKYRNGYESETIGRDRVAIAFKTKRIY